MEILKWLSEEANLYFRTCQGEGNPMETSSLPVPGKTDYRSKLPDVTISTAEKDPRPIVLKCRSCGKWQTERQILLNKGFCWGSLDGTFPCYSNKFQGGMSPKWFRWLCLWWTLRRSWQVSNDLTQGNGLEAARRRVERSWDTDEHVALCQSARGSQ